MLVNGQGQCHGLTSCVSLSLAVFNHLLGIDMLYRGGTSYGDKTGQVSNSVEKHQWLQVTFRPSMESFVVDLWYADSLQDKKYILMPLHEAMKDLTCPHAKLLVKTKLEPLQPSDIAYS